MIEARLVQGSTLFLTKSVKNKENRDVLFNFRIYDDSGLVKLIVKYNSEDNFIDCFRNIKMESNEK